MIKTLIGLFGNRKSAGVAVEDLKDSGYTAKDISIILKDDEKITSRTVTEDDDEKLLNPVTDGAVSGATLGALAGLLIGIGAIIVPGIGALLIGGPLAAGLGLTGAAATTLSGAVTGALAGGLVGALIGIGVPEEEARIYERRINEGAVLVAVPVTAENEGLARHILENNEAEKITEIGLD